MRLAPPTVSAINSGSKLSPPLVIAIAALQISAVFASSQEAAFASSQEAAFASSESATSSSLESAVPASSPGTSSASETSAWKQSTEEALAAYARGDLKTAERLLNETLQEAEKFGAKDERLYKSLENLALIYCKIGHYQKAEPLLKRALSIREENAGSDTTSIAQPLQNLGRSEEHTSELQ